MSDLLRTEPLRPDDAAARADREAKIEQLLLTGLDHYFAGHYDQAINVWTRALFLDRNHARARAYIERARSAQAERLRESEALLHDGAAAVRRGDSAEARRLLDAAMAQSGPSDEVLVLLERVERLEHLAAGGGVTVAQPLRVADDAPRQRRGFSAGWLALALLLVVIVAAGVFATGATPPEWGALIERALSRGANPAAAAGLVQRDSPSPPLPRRAEATLARARALVDSGRLRDALPLLESIRPTDPERAEADRLRGDIQRQLIALGPLPASPVQSTAPEDRVQP